jgi:hypothetical protein
MSRILKRPMFKMGGSTSEGITSGLSRKGYHEGGSGLSTQERLLRAVGPRRSNVYDFLTEWGLNMASSPPMGNVIQTAAGTARDPYKNFLKGKQDEDNLLRQVALEGESIDIKAEQAALAADAEHKLKRELLKTRGEQQKELYKLERDDIEQDLIKADIEQLVSPDGGIYDTIIPATNHANWKRKKSKKYPQDKIGGVLTKKQLNDPKFPYRQGKKTGGVGTIYYDPFGDRVLEIARVEGEYIFRLVEASSSAPVEGTTSIIDNKKAKAKEIRERFKFWPPEQSKKIDDYMEGIEKVEGEFGSGA